MSAVRHADGETYRSQGGDEQDGLDENDVYIDFGEDSDEDLRKAVDESIQQAKENGLSDWGLRSYQR